MRLLTVLLLSCLLAGCFFGGRSKKCNKPQEYQESRSVGGIEVPDDLDRPRRAPMEIPPVSGDTNQRPPSAPCLEEPPSYSG